MANESARSGTSWPLALVLIAVLLAMGRISAHDFAGWDNAATLSHNPRFNPPSWSSVAWYWTHAEYALYIPVTQTAWAGLAAIAQLRTPDERGSLLNPWVFHGANVLVHLLCTALVFHLLRRLIDGAWPAALGAAIFGLHPLQVETIAWASGMKDLLYALFSLAALIAYVDYARTSTAESTARRRRYVLATLWLVLAMLSKPTAMVTPVMAVAIDWLLLRRPLRRILASAAPWLVLSLACGVATRMVQGAEAVPGPPLLARPFIAGDALAFYLWKLVAPINLVIDYGRRPAVVMQSGLLWITWLLPAVIGGLAWWWRRRHPWLAAGAVLFLIPLLPVLGLVPFDFQGYSTVADHYVYLPLLGVALIVAGVMRSAGRRTGMALGAAAVVLGILSFRQAGTWSSEIGLWRRAVEVNPQSWIAHAHLGDQHAAAGQVHQAIERYRASVAAYPGWTASRAKLAVLLLESGEHEEALLHLEAIEREVLSRPVELRFNLGRTWSHMGRALLALDRVPEAIARFEQALAAEPGLPAAEQGLREAQSAQQQQPP